MTVADVWDAQAAVDPWAAVWSEPGSWAAGVMHCLNAVVPAVAGPLENTPLDGGRGWGVEVGCGVGRLTEPIAAIFPRARIDGFDVSPAMLDVAADRPPRVTYHLIADGRETGSSSGPFGWWMPDGTVDAFWSVVTFQHIDDDGVAAYLAEFGRLLRPGGVARFQTVVGDLHDGLDHRRPAATVAGWCEAAGLDVTVDADVRWQEWAWFTAVKP